VSPAGDELDEVDPVEWTRRRSSDTGQPAPELFVTMVALMRTHQQVITAIDELLKEHDITRTGWLVLSTLQMSEAHARPLGQLGRHMLVHPTTVTLVVDQLEKRGLVRRARHPTDRRTILAELTDAGARVAEKASAALAERGFGLGPLDPDAALRLQESLKDVRDVVDHAR
jgi:DNA-binding MarR family transcriptional regulator